MAKQKKRLILPIEKQIETPPPDPPLIEQIEHVDDIEHGKPRRFAPDPCPMCITDRPTGSNFSRVYGRDGKVRYIRCHFCNHRYKQVGH